MQVTQHTTEYGHAVLIIQRAGDSARYDPAGFHISWLVRARFYINEFNEKNNKYAAYEATINHHRTQKCVKVMDLFISATRDQLIGMVDEINKINVTMNLCNRLPPMNLLDVRVMRRKICLDLSYCLRRKRRARSIFKCSKK